MNKSVKLKRYRFKDIIILVVGKTATVLKRGIEIDQVRINNERELKTLLKSFH